MHHERILLVVFDAQELVKLSTILSETGAEIIACREAEAAQALLSQIKPQILISDLSFPPLYGGEGIKLVQHVKARIPNVVNIGLAHPSEEQLEQLFCRTKGKLFTRPFASEALIDFILSIRAAKPNAVGKVHHISLLDDFLRSNSIDSVLQPIVGIRKDNDGQILGVESLARPRSSESLWNPEMLFDYADRKDKTYETDLICIRAALSEANNLSAGLRLFINVRPRSVTHDGFALRIAAMAKEYNFNAQQIIFELTEQQTIANLQEFNRSLQDVREQGFGLAIDDFGAGYANLEWLQCLKPDFLKLSGVFSNNLDKDASKQVIVRAATQMARRLDIPTILENIERAEELEKARALGIDFGQGYLFYEPKPAKELNAVITGFQSRLTP